MPKYCVDMMVILALSGRDDLNAYRKMCGVNASGRDLLGAHGVFEQTSGVADACLLRRVGR
jgi:hypothetical protein